MNRLCVLKKVLLNFSRRAPSWLFRFNVGTIYFSSGIELKCRSNHQFSTRIVVIDDLLEISKMVDAPREFLTRRFNSGDLGLVSTMNSNGKIVTVQWAHFGKTFIRGYGLELDIPDNGTYLYLAHSAPEVRITGVFINAFQRMLELLSERGVSQYFCLVEDWNESARKFHERLDFKPIVRITHIRLFFFRFLAKRDVTTGKWVWGFRFREPLDVDII